VNHAGDFPNIAGRALNGVLSALSQLLATLVKVTRGKEKLFFTVSIEL
jgi:hypothetical protein